MLKRLILILTLIAPPYCNASFI